ncbi:hypothetical protein [Amycolatopsis lexingtonensis]|uniref:hypothetical protein n=1 Tax=Amycolatopsis lexingtonensis TaxID=218822 RepID=UPI003F6E6CC0
MSPSLGSLLGITGSLGLTGFVGMLMVGFAPTFVLELVIRLYPPEHPRRDELRAEYAFVVKNAKKDRERLKWVGQQLATALFDGLPVRAGFLWRKLFGKPKEPPGGLRYRRVSRPVRVMTLLVVAAVDLPLFLWTAGEVFGVGLNHPVVLPSAITVVISFLALYGATTIVREVGHNLRVAKTDRRRVDWAQVSLSTLAGLIIAGVLVVLVGFVAFSKLFSTFRGVAPTTGSLQLALLAALIASLVVGSFALVLTTAFLDGVGPVDLTTDSVGGRGLPFEADGIAAIDDEQNEADKRSSSG